MKKPLAILLLGMLSGCGVAAEGGPAAVNKSGPTSPAGYTPSGGDIGVPAATNKGLFHARLNMSVPLRQGGCGDYGRGGPPTLAEDLQAVRPDSPLYRAAAIATVDSVGTAVWNTPDGHRWTQAEVNAGTVVDPGVYTPYVLKIQRLLAGTQNLSVGQTITGYQEGGTTAFGDTLKVCGYGPVPTPQPQAARTFVVIFGGEVDTPNLTGPPHRPTITDLEAIENGAVQTAQGPQPIP